MGEERSIALSISRTPPYAGFADLMAGDAGRQEDHARPTLNETQPLTDITNETVDDPPKTIPTEDNRDQPPPSNETATNKDKRRTTQEDQYRPATATPSLFTQHSVDSGIGDEDEVASGQHQHDAIDQQPNNTGGNDGQEAPLVTTGYEDLNTTQDQPGGQHGALAGEQLAREQDLVADVRRVPKRRRRRRRPSDTVSHKYVFSTGIRQRLGSRERHVRSLTRSRVTRGSSG